MEPHPWMRLNDWYHNQEKTKKQERKKERNIDQSPVKVNVKTP